MILQFDTITGGYADGGKRALISVTAKPNDERPEDMLSGGWLPDPVHDNWYMSRSTRINLSLWNLSGSCLRSHTKVRWSSNHSGVLESFDIELLQEYWRRREIPGYPIERLLGAGRILISRGEFEGGKCWCAVSLTGGTAMYPLCAYVSSDNKISAGKACWSQACAMAASEGVEYLYTFEGYCRPNSYKASFPGFEWWTGSEWSPNAEEYLKALERDVNV